jgi:putative ABC transport system substrate-binding protein
VQCGPYYYSGTHSLAAAKRERGCIEDFQRQGVRLNVDVIVTHGSVGGLAAKNATASIPIVVATASDLVGSGLVTSLAHPGGNVTGTSDQAGEVVNKNLDLVAEVMPGLRRVAVLWYRGNPTAVREAEALQVAARNGVCW